MYFIYQSQIDLNFSALIFYTLIEDIFFNIYQNIQTISKTICTQNVTKINKTTNINNNKSDCTHLTRLIKLSKYLKVKLVF